MHPTRILTIDEITAVVTSLRRRAQRSPNSFQNLIIFRLACCSGLRRREAAGLSLGDLCLSGPKPAISVPKEVAKGRRPRVVPLYWDAGTLADLRAWYEYRKAHGATADSPFLCSLSTGKGLIPDVLARRWRTAIRILGPQRVRQVSIHAGRHTFCSLALAGGRSLVEVQRAAGHANVSTTNIYLHLIERQVPDLFPV